MKKILILTCAALLGFSCQKGNSSAEASEPVAQSEIKHYEITAVPVHEIMAFPVHEVTATPVSPEQRR